MKIVFYDGECGLCDWAVAYALKFDKKKVLFFAAQSGETFQRMLGGWKKQHPEVDSIIFFDTINGATLLYSKAIFRICWHLGFLWKLVGIFSFLPNWFFAPFNMIYRFIAKRRKGCSIFLKDSPKNREKFTDRFFP